MIGYVVTKLEPGCHGPGSLQGHRDWNSGICDCADDGYICCCVMFNPCYSCSLAQRIGETFCLPLFAGLLPLRLKARYALGIRGSACSDCAVTCCCGCCSMCQLAREIDSAQWP